MFSSYSSLHLFLLCYETDVDGLPSLTVWGITPVTKTYDDVSVRDIVLCHVCGLEVGNGSVLRNCSMNVCI